MPTQCILLWLRKTHSTLLPSLPFSSPSPLHSLGPYLQTFSHTAPALVVLAASVVLVLVVVGVVALATRSCQRPTCYQT
jgi:hypothetical protein